MPTGQLNRFLDRVRRAALVRDGAGMTDGQLLTRFVRQRDGNAFAALLHRHGPLVLGVCRRVLGNPHDAEDAFQATFLVFARKAGSVASPNALAGWLCRVAYRTALEARTRLARRRTKEQQVKEMPHPVVEPDDNWHELLPLLDRELDRLPEKYRVPLVLCELEGGSRKDVARRLGLPEGTLSWRLAHGRKLLAQRLSRYGTALSVGALAAVLSRDATAASVPTGLLGATAEAARHMAAGRALTAGIVSAQVITLTDGVLRAMLLSKLKAVWVAVLVVSLSAGVGVTYRATAGPLQQTGSGARAADELEELRLEIAALRKGLQATRDQVKALQAEVTVLRGHSTVQGDVLWGPSDQGFPVLLSDGTVRTFDKLRAEAQVGALREKMIRHEVIDDLMAQVQAILKKLREHPGDKQAADALDRALQQLKERAKERSPNKDPQKN
jgi:RNA polymerase sigma factor (sigma-70 family)